MAKIQIDINVEGDTVVIGINGSAETFGWAAAWGAISDKIKIALLQREQKIAASKDETIESLAKLINKTVQETRELCEATGKDLSVAMLEVALQFMSKKVEK